jgi:hypothetical protein|tara:strand:- start:358 stop:621 length:264 start_codon:yes stop_codon:yes gene_type:complete
MSVEVGTGVAERARRAMWPEHQPIELDVEEVWEELSELQVMAKEQGNHRRYEALMIAMGKVVRDLMMGMIEDDLRTDTATLTSVEPT